MTLLPTVEAFPDELLLLEPSPFWSQLSAFSFVVAFFELGTLTMFHKVSLNLIGIVCHWVVAFVVFEFNSLLCIFIYFTKDFPTNQVVCLVFPIKVRLPFSQKRGFSFCFEFIKDCDVWVIASDRVSVRRSSV